MRQAQSLQQPRIAVRGNSDFGYVSQLPRELRDEIMLKFPYPELARLCQEAPELCPPSMWTKRAGVRAENASQYLEVTQNAKWTALVRQREEFWRRVHGTSLGVKLAREWSLPDAVALLDRELVEYALSVIPGQTVTHLR